MWTSSSFVWRKRFCHAFEGPFVLALKGFEAFEGFEGGFEAFVLTFEAFEGFHTDGAKAHRWLASPLNDGSLVNAAGLKLSHTCV